MRRQRRFSHFFVARMHAATRPLQPREPSTANGTSVLAHAVAANKNLAGAVTGWPIELALAVATVFLVCGCCLLRLRHRLFSSPQDAKQPLRSARRDDDDDHSLIRRGYDDDESDEEVVEDWNSEWTPSQEEPVYLE